MARIPIQTSKPRRAQNNIVTRGMGPRQNLVRQGFIRGFFAQVIRFINLGQSGAKRALRELEEVIVWAKLIRVNDEPPPVKVQGYIVVKINAAARYAVTAAQQVSTRVRNIFESIKISIKRIR